MRGRLLKQASREYGPKPRLALLAVAGVFFVIILPLALLGLGGLLDRWLGWPKLTTAAERHPGRAHYRDRLAARPVDELRPVHPGPGHTGAGHGDAEAADLSPLLVLPQPDGPGRRRGLPRRLRGRRVAGRGAALALGAVALLTYIRLVEEKEMVARFGEAYLAYRRRVPFIIPRLHRSR